MEARRERSRRWTSRNGAVLAASTAAWACCLGRRRRGRGRPSIRGVTDVPKLCQNGARAIFGLRATLLQLLCSCAVRNIDVLFPFLVCPAQLHNITKHARSGYTRPKDTNPHAAAARSSPTMAMHLASARCIADAIALVRAPSRADRRRRSPPRPRERHRSLKNLPYGRRSPPLVERATATGMCASACICTRWHAE